MTGAGAGSGSTIGTGAGSGSTTGHGSITGAGGGGGTYGGTNGFGSIFGSFGTYGMNGFGSYFGIFGTYGMNGVFWTTLTHGWATRPRLRQHLVLLMTRGLLYGMYPPHGWYDRRLYPHGW